MFYDYIHFNFSLEYMNQIRQICCRLRNHPNSLNHTVPAITTRNRQQKSKVVFTHQYQQLFIQSFFQFTQHPEQKQAASQVSICAGQTIHSLNSTFKIFQTHCYLAYYSLMNTFRKINTATIETKVGTATSRKLKSRRNNSLPDLSNLARQYQASSKEKLKYNKWYIKPDLRLKTTINSQTEFQQSADRFTHYYESLYNTPPNFQNEYLLRKSQKTVRMGLAQQLCGDLQNIRMLINFKRYWMWLISKKQGGRKRIPGVIDYFLKFKQREDAYQKKNYLKRRKIAS